MGLLVFFLSQVQVLHLEYVDTLTSPCAFRHVTDSIPGLYICPEIRINGDRYAYFACTPYTCGHDYLVFSDDTEFDTAKIAIQLVGDSIRYTVQGDLRRPFRAWNYNSDVIFSDLTGTVEGNGQTLARGDLRFFWSPHLDGGRVLVFKEGRKLLDDTASFHLLRMEGHFVFRGTWQATPLDSTAGSYLEYTVTSGFRVSGESQGDTLLLLHVHHQREYKLGGNTYTTTYFYAPYRFSEGTEWSVPFDVRNTRWIGTPPEFYWEDYRLHLLFDGERPYLAECVRPCGTPHCPTPDLPDLLGALGRTCANTSVIMKGKEICGLSIADSCKQCLGDFCEVIRVHSYTHTFTFHPTPCRAVRISVPFGGTYHEEHVDTLRMFPDLSRMYPFPPDYRVPRSPVCSLKVVQARVKGVRVQHVSLPPGELVLLQLPNPYPPSELYERCGVYGAVLFREEGQDTFSILAYEGILPVGANRWRVVADDTTGEMEGDLLAHFDSCADSIPDVREEHIQGVFRVRGASGIERVEVKGGWAD